MGKASNELNQNRSSVFEELNEEIPNIEDDATNISDDNIMTDEDWESIVSKIHQEIIQYTQEQGLHLCEFLKFEDLEQCLLNILSHNS